MERRKFFKIFAASVAAPTIIIKAVSELKKDKEDIILAFSTPETSGVTGMRGTGDWVNTRRGKMADLGRTYVKPSVLNSKGLNEISTLYNRKFNEGDHIYNEDGFYVVSDGKPVLIGTMFEQGRESAF